MRIAMISYNTFVRGQANGLKTGSEGGNSILLFQNADGKAWGMTQFISSGDREQQWHKEAKVLADPLWEQLKNELPTLDRVVFYVGSTGAERVIELAAEHGLAPECALFVFCDCNMSRKQGVIRERGFSSSKVLYCECGGHSTMARIYQMVLNGDPLPA
ncbi:MAG: hypothetical protein EXS48_01865 [Candidatus Staskawiczbacteria bacterium]|nr:hypothetical protein [Candidatus Staskawiczbacteria bacterium]